ncbi:NAC domain-containing protein 17-like [Tasmannia lanceolata]|uniref:NAC domain-containing protein 17-like n=1 Tax=Tasmannia lanceolata TaxID=3420 RepID=UPI0040633EE9
MQSEFSSCGVSKMWPPGFRFHPTDEELILYYLKRKICHRRIRFNVIAEIDVYKFDPWELPEKSLLQTGDKQWYFFSPRDRKYPNGSRSNRATQHGYWKATGKDRTISQNCRPVGVKKTLIFYNGRAPKGERTDWVMHEYTMDEKELQNCNAVQDSYALYKIYRKSGSGPKNGEQYGAPFREEEWLDDDQVDDILGNPINTANPLLEAPCGPSVDSYFGSDESTPSLSDLEEVLKQMVDGPEVNHHVSGNLTCASEIDGEDQTQHFAVGSSAEEPIFAEPTKVLCPDTWIADAQTSLQNTHSVSPPVQPYEAPEVTSAFNWFEQDPLPTEGKFVEDALTTEGDFVELNDLIDPKPGVSSFESISNNCPFREMGVSYHTDAYFDAPLFLPEEIPAQNRTAPQPYLVDTVSQLDYFLTQPYDDENQYHAAHLTTQLWTHEQFNVFTSTESSQVVMAPPTSVYDGSLTNVGGEEERRGVSEGGASESWFNSSIHALLESIPSHPASASENALINRAIERMSSFGAVRIGARDRAVGGRREAGNRGFFFVSFLVALWAILWVLAIGMTLKILKSFLGRFMAS